MIKTCSIKVQGSVKNFTLKSCINFAYFFSYLHIKMMTFNLKMVYAKRHTDPNRPKLKPNRPKLTQTDPNRAKIFM